MLLAISGLLLIQQLSLCVRLCVVNLSVHRYSTLACVMTIPISEIRFSLGFIQLRNICNLDNKYPSCLVSNSAATDFAKIIRFTKYVHWIWKKITRFETFALKFAVSLELIQLFTLLPKNLYVLCKFVKTSCWSLEKSIPSLVSIF